MSLAEWVTRPPRSIRGELEERWINFEGGERSLLAERAFLVRPTGEAPGRLIVTTWALYFDPDPPGSAGVYYDPGPDYAATSDEKTVHVPRLRWPVQSIQRVLLRRHRMLESAVEIFLRGDSCGSVFVRFEDSLQFEPNPADGEPRKRKSRVVRDEVLRAVFQVLPRAARDRSQRPRSDVRSLVEPATAAWRAGALSNFDYLMELNTLAGRSVHDLCQYPVFPWVLSNYDAEELDLEDARNYRDLGKPMGALDPSRLEQFQERYETFDDPTIPKFMYGSHYSTAAGVVLHFLVRVEPFRSLHIEMHDGRYDVPDRLFTNLPAAYKASSTSTDLGEVRELTPEFYTLAAAFENRGDFDMGSSQDGVPVGAVTLPPWAKNSAQKFVRTMRAALESGVVSSNLHRWINLVFGFEQRGPNAVRAHNVFYYLTYPGAVDIEAEKDPYIRKAISLQIAHFGQCPEQLDARDPWPVRDYVPGPKTHFTLRPRPNVDVGFSVDAELVAVAARVIRRGSVVPPAEAGGKPRSGSVLAAGDTTSDARGADEDKPETDDGGGGGLLVLRTDGSLIALARATAPTPDEEKRKPPSVRGIHRPDVVAWSSDGTFLAAPGRAAVGTVELTVLDPLRADGTCAAARATLAAHESPVSALAFDDGLLVTGAEDGAARLWRVGRAGALRRAAVWTRPRRFLRGHASAVTCASACRAMGVVATGSKASGVVVHDTLSGKVMWCRPETSPAALAWDRKSASLLVSLGASTTRVEELVAWSLDGAELGRVSWGAEPARCVSVVAPNVVVVAKPGSVDVLELPWLTTLQTWPIPDVVAVSPSPSVPRADYLDDHVVVNLVTSSRSVFVLRRMAMTMSGVGAAGSGGAGAGGGLGVGAGAEGAARVFTGAPTAVVGAVSSAVSGAARGQTMLGALDTVRKGVSVGKGVAGEAWDLFSVTAASFASAASSKASASQQGGAQGQAQAQAQAQGQGQGGGSVV